MHSEYNDFYYVNIYMKQLFTKFQAFRVCIEVFPPNIIKLYVIDALKCYRENRINDVVTKLDSFQQEVKNKLETVIQGNKEHTDIHARV